MRAPTPIIEICPPHQKPPFGNPQSTVYLRNAFAPYRGQNPQNREKRVSESKNPPFPTTPEKGAPSQKNPHFPCSALYRNGDFLTWSALFWGGGKWGFFDSETLLSRFWGFRPPVRGKRIHKVYQRHLFWDPESGKTGKNAPKPGLGKGNYQKAH